MQVLQDDIRKAQPLKYLVKFGITLGLLFFIVRSIDPVSAKESIAQVTPLGIILALLLQIASNSVAAFRWFLIMQRIGFSQPFSFFLKSFFKGTFFSQGLPTSIGGDGIRILDSSRNGKSTLDAFYGVFIDRIVGLAGLLLLNMVALLLNRDILPTNIHFGLLGIVSFLFCGLFLLYFLRKFPIFAKGKLGFLGSLSDRFFRVYSDGRSIIAQLTLSVITHLLAMTAFYILGVNIGLEYPLYVYLILVPPVILLIILPISLAGWGLREGAMVGFFLLIGADKSKVLSFSVLYGLIALAGSLPGLFVYLVQKNKI